MCCSYINRLTVAILCLVLRTPILPDCYSVFFCIGSGKFFPIQYKRKNSECYFSFVLGQTAYFSFILSRGNFSPPMQYKRKIAVWLCETTGTCIARHGTHACTSVCDTYTYLSYNSALGVTIIHINAQLDYLIWSRPAIMFE